MKGKYVTYLTVLFLLAFACEKAPQRIDDFLIEFATVIKPSGQTTFQLDNNKTLIPKELKSYSGKDGQRVILNFSPWRGDTVKINSVSDIFTGTVQQSDIPANLIQDPVKIQSIWVGGNYLNMILEIEYYEKNHIIALFHDTKSPDINLYFSHFKDGDPPGYAKKLYASFSLSAIKSVNDNPTPFHLHINTYAGMRVWEMEMK